MNKIAPFFSTHKSSHLGAPFNNQKLSLVDASVFALQCVVVRVMYIIRAQPRDSRLTQRLQWRLANRFWPVSKGRDTPKLVLHRIDVGMWCGGMGGLLCRGHGTVELASGQGCVV